jgi:uncharacterized protein
MPADDLRPPRPSGPLSYRRLVTEDTRIADPGPLAPAARALGPDLARGFMLLFIALANTHYFLSGAPVLGGYPRDGSAVDSALVWLLSAFVDGRAFPMFGLLFGYGVAQIVRRHQGLGPKRVRRLLWRRSAILVAVGLVDGLLFYAGDILTAYGVLLLVGAWFVRLRDRWLVLLAVPFFALGSLPGADSLVISTAPPGPGMLPPDVGAMFTERPAVLAFVGLLGPIGFMCPFLAGLWAGRRRILERPAEHRVLLRVVAAAGIGAAVLGAQPVSLVLAGVTPAPAQGTLELMAALHQATGMLGGFGYAALLALVATRVRAEGRLVTAVAATGQRSMTCYLLQSVTWAVVFTPFLLDLSGRLTVTGTALLATATWAATVVAADRMRRAGHRGPFELLVRRVSYGAAVRPGERPDTSRP